MTETASPLSVKMDIGSRKEQQDLVAIVNPMSQLFAKHLADLGLDGSWILEPIKRTGGGGQDRVVFKRINRNEIRGGKKSLLYLLRPTDRDSSWLVHAIPPPYIDIEALSNRLLGTQIETGESALVSGKKPVQSNFAVNQVCIGRVVAHGANGLEVQLDDKYPGFIPLADICEGKYDRKQMLKFPVGKRLRLVISEAENEPIVCSTRVEGIVATDRADDVFTGKPSEDGSLKLNGFHRAPDRVYELIKWIAMDAIDREPDRIPPDTAFELVTSFMQTNYGAKTVERRAAGVLLGAICAAIEPMLSKDDSGYAITEFGWSEIGGKDSFRVKRAGSSVPAPSDPEIDRGQHVVMEQEQTSDDEVPIGDIVAYMANALRLAEVSSQIEALEGEQRSLKVYLESKENVRDAAERLNKHLAKRPS